MATGDLDNNLVKLRTELVKIKFPVKKLPSDEARLGEPGAFLPALHYVLLNFSKPFAKEAVESGFELTGKTDLRFVETVWRLLREQFNYRPSVSVNQFLSQGFAERKMLLMCDVVSLVKRKHSDLMRDSGRPLAVSKRKTAKPTTSAHIWGSPVEKNVAGIIHRSPPTSATPKRRNKGANNKTPQHLKGPQGQIEMVDGENIAVEIVRANWAEPAQEEPQASEEDVPRSVMPVFSGSFAGWAQQPTSSSPGGIPRIEARVPDLPRVVYESEEEEEEKEAGGAEKTDEKQVVLMPPVCAEDDGAAVMGASSLRASDSGSNILGVVEGLRRRLEATEGQMSSLAEESARERQTMQARITILEGRVRFLEGAIEESRESTTTTNAVALASEPATERIQPRWQPATRPMSPPKEADPPSTVPVNEIGEKETALFPAGFHRSPQAAPVSKPSPSRQGLPADAADFISNITGRFEAARALLDSM